MTKAYKNLIEERRVRMTREIAETLLEARGANAHTYALEKLISDNPNYANPELWRDVLAWLDELTNGESND